MSFSKPVLVSLICLGLVAVLPAAAFLFKPPARVFVRPVFAERTLKLIDAKDSPALLLSIPQDWTAQDQTEDSTLYRVQFYPPLQNKFKATDFIDLQVFKFHVANNEDDLNRSVDLIMQRNKLENKSFEVLSRVNYLQNALHTVEIISSSQHPTSNQHRMLSITKFIASPDITQAGYGFIMLQKTTQLLFDDKDIELAKQDLELYRSEFRKIKLINWNSVQASSQEFETKYLYFTGDKSGPGIAIDLPKVWNFGPIEESPEFYTVSITTPEDEIMKSLRFDATGITATRGVAEISAQELLQLVYDETKKAVLEKAAQTKFSPLEIQSDSKYLIAEYDSVTEVEGGLKLYGIYREIYTGDELGNSLSMLSMRHFFTMLDIKGIKSEADIEKYKQSFRNVRLLNWTDRKFLKPEFETKILDIANNGEQLSLLLPKNWQLSDKAKDEIVSVYQFSPKKTRDDIVENIELTILDDHFLCDEFKLDYYLKGFVREGLSLDEGFVNPSGLRLKGYRSYQELANGMVAYKSGQAFCQDPIHSHGFGLISKTTALMKTNVDEELLQANQKLYLDKFAELELLNWQETGKPKPRHEDRQVDFKVNLPSVVLPLYSDWKLADSLNENGLEVYIFKPDQNYLGINQEIALVGLNTKLEYDSKSLQSYANSLKKSEREKNPGVIFSDQLESNIAAYKTLEYLSSMNEKGTWIINFTKLIAIDAKPDRLPGVIRLKFSLKFMAGYDESRMKTFIENFKRRLDRVKVLD